METRRPLGVITIDNPCAKSWEQMHGDDRVRYCNHCRKNVHDLSAMTRSEAEQLLCNAAGELCIRYEKDSAGKVITLDYAGRVDTPDPAARKGFWDRVFIWTGIGYALIYIGWGAVRPTRMLGAYRCPVSASASPATSSPSTAKSTAPASP